VPKTGPDDDRGIIGERVIDLPLIRP